MNGWSQFGWSVAAPGGEGPPPDGFTPASLPNLLDYREAASWIYTDAGVTEAAEGDLVQQWGKSAGSLNLVCLQDTSGKRPVFHSGGGGYLDFDAVNDSWIRTEIEAVNMGASDLTQFSMFVVVRPERGDGYSRYIAYSGQNHDFQVGSMCFAQRADGPDVDAEFGPDTPIFTGVSTHAPHAQVLVATMDGANVRLYVDGELVRTVGQADGFINSIGTYGFGAYLNSSGIASAGGNNATGRIYAAGMVGGVLSSDNVFKLQTYFAERYNVGTNVLKYIGSATRTSAAGAEFAEWTNVPIGPAYASRRVILIASAYDGNAIPITGAEINGVACELIDIASAGSGQLYYKAMSAVVPAGTTCTAKWLTPGGGQFGVSAVQAFTIDDSRLTSWPPNIVNMTDNGPTPATSFELGAIVPTGANAIMVGAWFGSSGDVSIPYPNDFGRFSTCDGTGINGSLIAYINGVDGGVGQSATIQIPSTASGMAEAGLMIIV